MIGDTTYELVRTAKTTASANTFHALITTLSAIDLSDSDAVFVQLNPLTNAAKWFPSSAMSAQDGVLVSAGNAYYTDLPPMSWGTIKESGFVNNDNGSDADVLYAIWRRVA